MNDKIISTIPLPKIFKLIAHLIKFSKGGISKEEGAVLLEDLAEIAGDVAGKLV